MKILVFEYITGGGFNKQNLPEALLAEGCLMLQALLDDLRRYAELGHELEVRVMLDERIKTLINTSGMQAVFISREQNTTDEFTRLAQHCDAIWPIAPEFDGLLQGLCQSVTNLNKLLLTSPAQAVAITGDKWLSYQHLKQHHIATVPTRLFTGVEQYDQQQGKHSAWVVKPLDGVACLDSYILTDRQDFIAMQARTGHYLIQPQLAGQTISLSCLFKQGRGWLLCANQQQFSISKQQYHLTEIMVNYTDQLAAYRILVDAIALALPELWGYVGIDLIETPEQTWVLEINPRLTTSFVGIYKALGLNVVEAIMQLINSKPLLKTQTHQAVSLLVSSCL
jgi:predicted ATP-grasp superfamily ATP-dependent carboligase